YRKDRRSNVQFSESAKIRRSAIARRGRTTTAGSPNAIVNGWPPTSVNSTYRWTRCTGDGGMQGLNLTTDWILWVLASPILFIRWIFRLARRWKVLQLGYRTELVCRNCRSPISLVGLWRCGCGYTYRG